MHAGRPGSSRRIPADTERLSFTEMTPGDLDDMAAMLGDPDVMRHYPRPLTRAEALGWINWNRGLYRQVGHGLWVIRSRDTGAFVGDCGLTPQRVQGVVRTEVGYHVRRDRQGRGYAVEAAAACREHARRVLGVHRLIAIIVVDNVPSQRVAERIGLRFERRTVHGRARRPVRIYAG